MRPLDENETITWEDISPAFIHGNGGWVYFRFAKLHLVRDGQSVAVPEEHGKVQLKDGEKLWILEGQSYQE